MINYSKYNYEELQQAYDSIDRKKYPENYKNLVREIKKRESLGEYLLIPGKDIDLTLKYKSIYAEVSDTPFFKKMVIFQLILFIFIILNSIIIYLNENHILLFDFRIKLIHYFTITLMFMLLISGVIKIFKNRICPNCKDKMQQINPKDNNSTFIHVCHKCKLYIDTKLSPASGVD